MYHVGMTVPHDSFAQVSMNCPSFLELDPGITGEHERISRAMSFSCVRRISFANAAFSLAVTM